MSETRVHIYCRVSSAGQEDGYSLDTQEAACRSWCAERGYPVASVAREVWSGGDRHRPELDALLDRLISSDIVLAYALDRVSRSQIDTAILIDRIESAGASLALVTEDFEQSATGVFLRNAKSFVAELEREKISERTQRGRRARAESGKPLPGAYAPYGLQWADSDKTRLELDPVTAPVVRDIYDLALRGVSLRQIAATLDKKGIPSPAGKAQWAACSVRHILTRPVYTGAHVAYRERLTRKPGGGYTRTASAPETVVTVPNVAPAIVSADEYAQVAAQMQRNQTQSVRNNQRPEATLLRSGFVFCGHCGWQLTAQNPPRHNPTRSAVYRCRSRTMKVHDCPQPGIAASLLDGSVWEKVVEVLRDPDIIAAEVAKFRHGDGFERELASIKKHIASIVDKQARIAKRVAQIDDDDVAALLLAELKTLSAQKVIAEAERDALSRRIADAEADATKVRSLAEWCQSVGVKLDRLSYDEKRLALDALGVRVRVWREDAGEAFPRWDITLRPVPKEIDGAIAFHTPRYSIAAPSATSAARRR